MGESNDGVGAGGAKKLGLSSEEIAKVREEWEERQKRKREKAKEKEKETEGDKDGKDKKEGAKDDKKASSPTPETPKPSSTPSTPSSAGTSSTPTHQRYTLHRDIFSMRLAEHRRRRQVAQAKELAPRLPSAPRTTLPSP